jgi:hypothetical protein
MIFRIRVSRQHAAQKIYHAPRHTQASGWAAPPPEPGALPIVISSSPIVRLIPVPVTCRDGEATCLSKKKNNYTHAPRANGLTVWRHCPGPGG